MKMFTVIVALVLIASPAVAKKRSVDVPDEMQTACSNLAANIQAQELMARILATQTPDDWDEKLGISDFAEANSEFRQKLEACASNTL